ncbi:MAG: IclR family transcriptional regulator [Thermoanaerobacterales bacterium]|jgi:DNA-binding IclR family transcriptional regulator|nr:IclR family transcriptional regulator [Thermoanaerobacterales bacterium]
MPDVARRAGGLARDLDLLRALATVPPDQGGLGVMRLAEIVGRDKSQVSRAMRALEAVGLVERDVRTLEYRLGTEVFALAAKAGPNRLLRTAPPHMQALAQQLDETVHLCVLAGTGVLTVASVPAPSHSFRATGWEGRVVPAHCTSAGRVLLMDAELPFIEQRFAGGDFSGGPGNRTTDPASLWSEICAARRRGYALVDEDFEPGLIGASAPVRDHHGRIVAAVNVSASKERSHARLRAMGEATALAARRLSEALGMPPAADRPATGPT